MALTFLIGVLLGVLAWPVSLYWFSRAMKAAFKNLEREAILNADL
jgi:hypothetical protein